MLALAGISIIALSWLIQLSRVDRGKGHLDKTFVITYGIGTALLLIAASDAAGFSTVSWLYLITLLIVGLLYVKIH